ncbi:MAG: anaerobic ribonucleoside-triphosphate reductase activating protein [Clostridia bacterium]|nr:anaerobic ribonucleoside-triphosphate reductase activating protein [Clostridia bacterium]
MKLHGLQKLTLLDFPGHVACTVFTPGCNLRCPFCHNALLVTDLRAEDEIPLDEFFSFLEKRKGLLDGVAVTGGEPLLQPDLGDFLLRVRSLGYAVKLDTNGCFPDRLSALIDAGLIDYAAMDFKNAPAKYPETVGIPGFDPAPVLESARILVSSGVPCEFRTTAVREFHTVPDIEEIARILSGLGAERYFVQCFKDSGGLIGKDLHPVARDGLFAMRDAARRFLPGTELRGVD